jgi:hypothetical protein
MMENEWKKVVIMLDDIFGCQKLLKFSNLIESFFQNNFRKIV